ncbi:dipeptide/oligopeptide/nickel ABC transporter permease/ATP-binding protein [Specibacter cremeus]|uniref:dipeptide/oligopeptide/nickel ABC transporter permease/ATP-binding protein n=1 Tax=Specibacter cremeus TaxID=1629051 RepID=UPI000F7817E5|nr:dipeptide/oligopeptide/nickel ABC transporter permease/ATP-binding protein [Specibacter cremeus]
MAARSTGSPWRTALLAPTGLAAAAGLAVLVLLVIFGPVIWGADATTADPLSLSQPPGAVHLFGTDAGGRDVLARTMTAARLSVLMALAASVFGVLCGVVVGSLPSVMPPRLGRAVVSIFNFAIAFPGLLLTIFLSVIFGQGATGALFAIGVSIIPVYARLTHTLSSSVGGRDFVAAARILGVGKVRVVARHILPNIAGPLIVNASVTAGGALIAFASLSFLGLGVQPPEFDWGRMLNEGLSKIFVNPATALAPGIAVVLAGIVFTLAGETLARATGVNPGLTHRLPRWIPRPALPAGNVLDDVSGNASGDAVLRVRNLRVAVPHADGWREPVKGVSFDVGRGEVVGIVGESGSGKSLSCLSVAGLTDFPLKVTADTIVFDGVETLRGEHRPAGVSARAVERLLGTRMAMVFQDPMSSLNPSLRVGGQVAEAGFIHGGLTRRQAWAKAVRRLADVKIPDPARRARQHPHELSGGMRQRAMIAMGLMGNPALIIADEPTTALDVTVQREVLSVLHDVQVDSAAAILLISHDIAVVTGLCSRVLVMYQGEIVEEIATADLVAGRARHPYTRALLAAVPTMDTDRSQPMATIAEVPA